LTALVATAHYLVRVMWALLKQRTLSDENAPAKSPIGEQLCTGAGVFPGTANRQTHADLSPGAKCVSGETCQERIPRFHVQFNPVDDSIAVGHSYAVAGSAGHSQPDRSSLLGSGFMRRKLPSLKVCLGVGFGAWVGCSAHEHGG